jgi:hypothetical protein
MHILLGRNCSSLKIRRGSNHIEAQGMHLRIRLLIRLDLWGKNFLILKENLLLKTIMIIKQAI